MKSIIIVFALITIANTSCGTGNNEKSGGNMQGVDTIALSGRATTTAKISINAEHISTNAGKIEHQREHFFMLSTDIYDLIKGFGTDKPLYKDYCPMAFDKKGAIWLSEVKEIKNPYFGNKMPTCGEVKEELK